MRVSEDVLQEVRAVGFAKVEGFLSPSVLELARAELFELVPEPSDYFSHPDKQFRFVASQFAGLVSYPFGKAVLNSVGTNKEIQDAAEGYCETRELRQHSINIWAKYSGAVDYTQTLHRDYSEKTTVVPAFSAHKDQFTAFVLLSDVTLDDGPTMFIARRNALSLGRSFERRAGLLSDFEQPMTGPAGTAYFFDYETVHRGSGMKNPRASRFVLTSEFVRADRPWLAQNRWADVARSAEWDEAIAALDHRQREFFGIPEPGDGFWTVAQLDAFEKRYPAIDLKIYRRTTSIQDSTPIPVDDFESRLLPLQKNYEAFELESQQGFPFAGAQSAMAPFDRSIVNSLKERFGQRAFRLVGAYALTSKKEPIDMHSALDRNSVLGHVRDSRWPQITVIIPLQGIDSKAITRVIFGDERSQEEIPIGCAGIVPGEDRLTIDAPPLSLAIIADFALTGAPGVGFTSWWMNADWQDWRDFLGAMPVDLLPIVGFPEPTSDYWTSQTTADVSARFPALDLACYLTTNCLK